MTKTRRSKSAKNSRLTVSALQKAARLMLPFYRRVVLSKTFADRWAKAVRKADVAEMDRMLQSVIGKVPLASLSSNAIGYFISFPLSSPIYPITNATSIRPGQVQFTFSSPIHRAIAKAVFPLYWEIASNTPFAALIVQAIHRKNKAFLNRLIRSVVPSRRLVKLEFEPSGLALGFKYPASKYIYYNEVFLELDL
ncbi:hypothetical protein [Paenibacillus hexagrammi]|uniref:Uncharacterized protein n=1 Tax=Paenibacillus hexagrammi TaxID=2908839 RepID=A0ABY3SHN0_9BACL|nr:hypothetical protein [Paenibacillus sp. YPD9-1]UJF33524.1 hypothetical protein L0M14_29175 [Paenibacillus sp. YPD9-1]